MPVDYAALADQARKSVPSPVDPSQWDKRADGSTKGNGFLGVLKRPDGRVSSEISIGVSIDGKEVEIPTLVPTLSPQERAFLLNNDISDANKIPAAIKQKAIDFARPRIAAGKSPFAGPSESPVDYAKLAEQARQSTPPDFHVDVKANDSPIGKTVAEGMDLFRGAVKRGIQTVDSIADFGRRHIPGVAALDTLAPPVPLNLERTTPLQKAGAAGEQILEVLGPSKAITGAGTKFAEVAAPRLAPLVGSAFARAIPRAAIEAGGGAALAAAQGGSPVAGAVLGAAVPFVGQAVQDAPQGLRDAAEKKVVQALGPTKERFKAIANRLAPEILKRGLGGSREALQAKAVDTLEIVGDQLDVALQAHGAQPIGVQPVIDALDTAKDAFRTTTMMPIAQAVQRGLMKQATSVAGGLATVPVEFEPRAIAQLNQLQSVVSQLGESATVDQLTAVRRAWDKVVAQAGGYAQRAGGAIGVPLKDQSEAFAKREGATAIRKLLADEVPDLAAVNKEYSFWKNLDDVLTQTLQRTQPQGPGLIKSTVQAGGQMAGAVSHGIPGAVIVGKLAGAANAVFTSPRWRFVDANLRNRLADAIANGNASQAAVMLTRISAVEGSKLPEAIFGQ